MSYDFDQIIERKSTWSLKWDYSDKIFGNAGVLPMWVADMDFKSPEAVEEAVINRAKHGIFGYTGTPGTLTEAVAAWMKKRNNWDISGKWVVQSPGVVTSLKASVLAFTEPGDKILIQTPVYPPFFSSVEDNGRKLVLNPLRLINGRYEMDFDDLEKKLAQGVRMMMFCSPHNPVGRVWNREELSAVCRLCEQYRVLLVSDEIHSDLIFSGSRHIPAAYLSGGIAGSSVTCISPTKTFNIAGLATSMAIIPDDELRGAFEKSLHRTGADMSNIFGQAAAEAAYRYGEQWLDDLLSYLEGSLNIVFDYFKDNIPGIRLIRPEGTYLVWMDCRELGMKQSELREFFIRKAEVGLNDGAAFGEEGAGFQRMNIACPKAILLEGLKRIERAVKEL